ncbi:hypothetical protein ABZ135_29840 [Streptomyces sp. NPDC006339]|uniref:hypothetical protein n=1 Tax=Streptomyces sp. NPDC006339 TaxID=3156755 RepID=UPI0033A46BF5
MHAYDPFRQQYPSPIPSMRPAQDVPAGLSPTPIYDALYSEYRRTFRTLPGDRSGEEELSFRAFGTGAAGTTGSTGYRQQARWSAYALPPGSRSGV